MRERPSRAAWLTAGMGALAGAGLAASPVRAQSVAPLKVGVGTVEAQAQAYYAQDMGFFKRAGLDVTLEQLRAGTAIAAAVAGSDLQVGCSNVISLGAAHQRGIPFVMIAGAAYYDSKAPTALAVVAPDSPIRTPKDLDGKVIGGISLGGLDQVAMWAFVDKNGGDVASLKYIELNPSIMAAALAQGRADAVSMNDPDLSAALAAKQVRVLGKAWDAIAPLFVQTAWFSTNDWLDRNKEAARRFARAVSEAGRWAMANPVPAAGILQKYLSSKEPRARMRFAEDLNPRFVQPVYDAAARYKLLAAIRAADFMWNGR